MSNKIFRSAVLFLLVAIAILLTVGAFRGTIGISGSAPELKLVPKDKLQTEQGSWTFAPEVPKPITRKEQRRVVVNWEARETQAEVAPGVIYDDYWTFEGHAPGPLLRVREGDLIEIHLTNNIKSMRSHNIDFHFASGPGGGAMALNVAPGETAVIEARAMSPGLFMFHCATQDIPTHIANGMYGYVLVDPAEGLPTVDHEWFVVQSELYSKAAENGHATFSMERGDASDPEYVLFNGKVGSMMGPNAPHAKVGERVRLYVGNAGPNLVSSFHVIGQIFDKVYREADLISPPARSIQTTLIPAGGAAVVEFEAQVPGTFLLVDHAIFRLHKGALASVVVDGPENAEVFHPVSAGAVGAEMANHDQHMVMPQQHSEPAPSKPAQKEAPAGLPTSEAVPPVEVPIPLPVTGVSAANFGMGPQMPGEEAEVTIVHILPGAGNYDKDQMNDYSPKVLTVKRGTVVAWTNDDTVIHNVSGPDGIWLSTILKPHDSWSKTFDKPGVYPFFCAPHPWMQGKILVR